MERNENNYITFEMNLKLQMKDYRIVLGIKRTWIVRNSARNMVSKRSALSRSFFLLLRLWLLYALLKLGSLDGEHSIDLIIKSWK
jgi:hypothetical protein